MYRRAESCRQTKEMLEFNSGTFFPFTKWLEKKRIWRIACEKEKNQIKKK